MVTDVAELLLRGLNCSIPKQGIILDHTGASADNNIG